LLTGTIGVLKTCAISLDTLKRFYFLGAKPRPIGPTDQEKSKFPPKQLAQLLLNLNVSMRHNAAGKYFINI